MTFVLLAVNSFSATGNCLCKPVLDAENTGTRAELR